MTTVHVDLRPEIKFEYGWGAKANASQYSMDDSNEALPTTRKLVWTCVVGGLTGDTFNRANMTIDAVTVANAVSFAARFEWDERKREGVSMFTVPACLRRLAGAARTRSAAGSQSSRPGRAGTPVWEY